MGTRSQIAFLIALTLTCRLLSTGPLGWQRDVGEWPA